MQIFYERKFVRVKINNSKFQYDLIWSMPYICKDYLQFNLKKISFLLNKLLQRTFRLNILCCRCVFCLFISSSFKKNKKKKLHHEAEFSLRQLDTLSKQFLYCKISLFEKKIHHFSLFNCTSYIIYNMRFYQRKRRSINQSPVWCKKIIYYDVIDHTYPLLNGLLCYMVLIKTLLFLMMNGSMERTTHHNLQQKNNEKNVPFPVLFIFYDAPIDTQHLFSHKRT